jgi:hypothetical protein
VKKPAVFIRAEILGMLLEKSTQPLTLGMTVYRKPVRPRIGVMVDSVRSQRSYLQARQAG